MATTAKTAAVKTARTPVALSARIKTQLSTATLRAKITPEELTGLAEHIEKLKSLL